MEFSWFGKVLPQIRLRILYDCSSIDQTGKKECALRVDKWLRDELSGVEKEINDNSDSYVPSRSGGPVVFIDASEVGLGCVLMQDLKVIAYELRRLKEY